MIRECESNNATLAITTKNVGTIDLLHLKNLSKMRILVICREFRLVVVAEDYAAVEAIYLILLYISPMMT